MKTLTTITTIFVFVIMIQRIFPSQESAPTHSTIVIRGCRFIYFHSLMKSAFLPSKGLLCLYDKQNNTWSLVDMEFLFSCSTRHLTRSLRSLVSYRVKHSKRNSVSTRAHVLFSIYHINCGVIQGFPALRKAVTTYVKKYRIFHVC